MLPLEHGKGRHHGHWHHIEYPEAGAYPIPARRDKNSLVCQPWPEYDAALTKEKEIELAVQVNGKIKDRIVVPADSAEEYIKTQALQNEKVAAAIAGKEPKKIIVIKSRLVNIVC